MQLFRRIQSLFLRLFCIVDNAYYMGFDYTLQLYHQEKQLAVQNNIIELMLRFFPERSFKLIEASSNLFSFELGNHTVEAKIDFKFKVDHDHAKTGTLVVTPQLPEDKDGYTTRFTFNWKKPVHTYVDKFEKRKIDAWYRYHAETSLGLPRKG